MSEQKDTKKPMPAELVKKMAIAFAFSIAPALFLREICFMFFAATAFHGFLKGLPDEMIGKLWLLSLVGYLIFRYAAKKAQQGVTDYMKREIDQWVFKNQQQILDEEVRKANAEPPVRFSAFQQKLKEMAEKNGYKVFDDHKEKKQGDGTV